MKKNNKGISAVVATVLIILITVAAVTIIWAAIIPMIQNQLEEGTTCLDASQALTVLNKGYTCFNDSGDEVRVQIAYGAKDIGLSGIQVLVSDASGNTNSTMVIANLPGNNGEKVVTVVHSTTAQSVAIAPRVSVGGQDKTCDASAAVDIVAC